ncbi:hypothetical protein L1987_79463 [Smallanthus sonchifolius]|uniref:Uncharacterized protein n=1 Tax=Smallanthus sonchifolius TaxID=185202 RepID=A0ACB8ZFV4_9ASTR|nr:hypothetical protein L1987_79463 [Smallanthus sonchifolius]
MLKFYTNVVLSLLFFLHYASAITSDGLSLLSVKSAVDGGATVLSDWNDNDDTPCHWTGVTCANISGVSDPCVVGLALAGRNLRGYIPSELGNLMYLRRLILHDNNFHGTIPDQIFNATSLHSIFLSGNNLSGELPSSICNPPRLQNIDLSHNSLSGTIQKFLGNCRELQRLILSGNKFSGEIPAGVFPEMANLVQLDFSSNSLNGSLPNDIGQLKSLSGTLNISFNHFNGKLPESLGDLPLTVSFDLRRNNFSGEIPQTGSFTNQGPTAFLNNPSLCGLPLQKTCRDSSSESSPGTKNFTPATGDNGSKKGLRPGLIWISQHGFEAESEKGDVVSGGGVSGGGGGEDGELVAIDKGFSIELDELLRASAYVLGKSGLGIVYKVVLGNGIPVAVRRLVLTWSTRLKITKGTARGLAYLHECSPRKFVHGDIKPSNILLDNEHQPYISDFGLNRLIDITGNNTSFGGFMGGGLSYLKSTQTEKVNNYRAPEARVSSNRPTQKWDVYSFDIVLLELLTGKSSELSSPTTSTSTEIPDLVKWVRKAFEEETPLSDMVDPMLLKQVHAKKEMLTVFHLALACTEQDPEIRPRMKTVSESLEKLRT